MPTQDYRLKDGSRVPGVTTVIGQLGWSKGALMYWAWDQGRTGKDFRETRDVAADAGTIAHAMIEADLKGKEIDTTKYPAELLSKAETGYLNFLEWKKGADLKVVASEVPLISERYRFGGTIDCPAFIRGRLTIVDWKTSNAVYEDYLIQIAAYGALWEENNPDQLLTGGFDLLRISKESGGFAHHHWDSLPGCFDAFLHLRDLYDLKAKLKKLK